MKGLVEDFKLEPNPIRVERLVQPFTPFDKVGRRFAVLGFEGGTFEAWGYPVKILRNFEFSFLLGTSTDKIHGEKTARRISATPEATMITFTHQSFVVRAIFVTPIDEPGAIIMLDVDSMMPMTVVMGFLSVLQPMWPAGIGGQYAYWDDNLKAYRISEPTEKNVGYVGSPAASELSYTPAHMLSDVGMEFKIEVDPQEARGKFIPIVLAGGYGDPEEYKTTYDRLANDPESFYLENVAYYRDLRESTLQVTTPVKKINLAFEWAKVAYDNLVVTSPFLGTGMVAGLNISGTGGRPGFGWYFSGDTFINSLSLVSYGAYSTVKNALKFTQKWQREDGKMAHELSQSAFTYIDWFEDYPYGYIHGDTTPWYLVAMGNYFKATGDDEFIRESWESLMKAYQWCLSTDENSDGLMENRAAGLGALEFGPLTDILTDIYLASIWVEGLESMKFLAEIMGEDELAEECGNRYDKAIAALNERFWDKTRHHLAYAIDAKGKMVSELTPWSALGLMWHLFDVRKSREMLTKINSAKLTTDWGVRCLSKTSSYYQPLNYNYGAVWPFITSFVSTAQFQHHFMHAGYVGLISTALHTFDNAIGNVTEVFSGDRNVRPGEAVHHQGFCSAGSVLPLIKGLLGLDIDMINRSVTFSPHILPEWDRLTITNIVAGSSNLDLTYQRRDGRIELSVDVEGDGVDRFVFSPALATSAINTVLVNGEKFPVEKEESAQDIHATVIMKIREHIDIVIEYTPTFEVVFPLPKSQTGDYNSGLKVVEIKRRDHGMEYSIEGLVGETYHLKVLYPERIKTVVGGTLEGDQIKVEFSGRNDAEFLRKEMIISDRR